MASKGLFIPSRFDVEQATRDLEQIRANAKAAGDQMRREFLEGSKSVKDFLADLRRVHQQTVASAREAQSRGLLSPQGFRDIKREADRAFNDSILPALRQMRKEGKENTEEFLRLQRSLRSVSREARPAAQQMKQVDRGFRDTLATASRLRVAVGAVVAALGIRRGFDFLRNVGRDAEELARSYLRAQSAAKLFGVAQSEIVSLSANARTEFSLTAREANELAVNITKLTARAGEAARSQQVLAAALDLGAAQGLSAAEVGVALEQTLRGLDEGTDKLFQKNPSQIYAEYAESIGKTAGQLTDVEQKQALVNAVLEAGGKVAGEYRRILDTQLGDLTRWRQLLQSAREEIGSRVIPITAKLTQALAGPLTSAMRGLNSILETFLTPAERLVLTLERMGAASEIALPAILEQRLERSRDRLDDLRKELGNILSEASSPGRLASALGGALAGQPAQFQTGEALPADIAGLARAQEQAIAQVAEAQKTADEAAKRRAQERLDIVSRALAVARQIAQEEAGIRQSEAGLDEARRRAATAAELEGVKARIATLVSESAAEGESAAREAAIRALEAQREALERELGRVVETTTPTTGVGAGADDAAARRSLEDARERMEKLVALQRAAADRGLNLQILPDAAIDRLREVVTIQEQIARAEEDIKLLSGDVPPEAGEVLDQMRARVAALNESLADLVTETDVLPRVEQTIRAAFSTTTLEQFEAAIHPITVGLRTVEAAVREAEVASADLRAARIAGDPERIAEAEERVARAQQRVAAQTRAVAAAMEDAGLSNDVVVDVVRRLEQALRDAGVEMEDVTDGASGFAATLDAVETAGRGLVSIADNLGAIDQQTRRSLTGVLDLISGFQQLQAAGSLSGLSATFAGIAGVGAIAGALVGIGSALFGPDAEQQQHIEELRRNTEALRSATERIAELAQSRGPFETAVETAVRPLIESFRDILPLGAPRTVEGARTTFDNARRILERDLELADSSEERTAIRARLAELDQAEREFEEFLVRLREQAEQELAVGMALAEGRTGDAAALELQLERERKLNDLRNAGLEDLIPKYEELFAAQDKAAAEQFEHDEKVRLLRIQGFNATADAVERQKRREEELAAARTEAERATIAARHAEEDLALQREAEADIEELEVLATGSDVEIQKFRAQEQYNDSVKKYTDLLAAGIIDQDKFNEVMKYLGVIFDKTVDEILASAQRLADDLVDLEIDAPWEEIFGDPDVARAIRVNRKWDKVADQVQKAFDEGFIDEEKFLESMGKIGDLRAFELAGGSLGGGSGGRRGVASGDPVVGSLRAATHVDMVTVADKLQSILIVNHEQLARLISIDMKTGSIAAPAVVPVGGGSTTNIGPTQNSIQVNAQFTGPITGHNTAQVAGDVVRQIGDQMAIYLGGKQDRRVMMRGNPRIQR